jgi:predicted dehydrogenase
MGDMGVHAVDFVRWSFGEIARVAARAGVAYLERQAPGVDRVADAEDHCAIVGEPGSGGTLTIVTSRVARGTNEHTLEAYSSGGSLSYRFVRDGERWWEGQLRATGSVMCWPR